MSRSKKSISDMFRCLKSGVLYDDKGVKVGTLEDQLLRIVKSRAAVKSTTVGEVLDELINYMRTVQRKGFQIRTR